MDNTQPSPFHTPSPNISKPAVTTRVGTEQTHTPDQIYRDSEEAKADKNIRDLLRDLEAAENRPVNDFRQIQQEIDAEFVIWRTIQQETAQETRSALTNAVKDLEKYDWLHKNNQHILYPRRAAA